MGKRRKYRRPHAIMALGYQVFVKVRNRIAEANSWVCTYCLENVYVMPDDSGKLATIDHRIPLSRGGTWKRYNLTCACRQCNHDKDNMTDAEYRLYLHLTREM